MTNIDIFSGFLGAGKTTLIRKLISEGYSNEKIVLIENEFGEIAIDGGFLKDAGVEITEMNSGCICCTLVGDFTKALNKVITEFNPDRIIIEPSGVGKLSEVSAAVSNVEGAHIGAKITVVDAGKCKLYAKNFGEFFKDQVSNADLVVFSRTDTVDPIKLSNAVEIVKSMNVHAGIVTTPWNSISGKMIVNSLSSCSLSEELKNFEIEHHHHDHDDDECGCEHQHHDHDDDECGCEHHDHDHDDDECDCEHHNHDHDDDERDCEHHHRDLDDECDCEHHHHDHDDKHGHHHHHHADEIFSSWGIETPKKFSEELLFNILEKLNDSDHYGMILRAKGILDCIDGEWLYFDFVPGEINIRRGSPDLTGKLCVIGSKINESALKELFEIGTAI